MRTLTIKAFTIPAVMMAILMMSMFGVFILLPIYLQNVLGLTTLQTGLLLLPGGLIMGLCAPTVGSLFDRYGPMPLVVPGAILFSILMWSLTFVQQNTPFWMLLIAHIVLSIGLALMFTPLFTASLGALPPNFYSHGSAMIGTTQQVAGAAGTALFVAIMTMEGSSLTLAGADARGGNDGRDPRGVPLWGGHFHRSCCDGFLHQEADRRPRRIALKEAIRLCEGRHP
jgi:DHA2 family lincomycin resistance protein-like MFS transporter